MAADEPRLTGRVVSFDTEVGLGHLAGDDGGRWLFHCTAIADGSRDIAVGTPVDFIVAAGGPGRWEAFEVQQSAAVGAK